MCSANAIVSTTIRGLGALCLRSREAMASGCANLIIARAEGFADARTYLECLKQLALCSCGSEDREWLFEVCSGQQVDWMPCPLLKRRAPSVMSLSNDHRLQLFRLPRRNPRHHKLYRNIVPMAIVKSQLRYSLASHKGYEA